MIRDRKALTDFLESHGLSSKECIDVAELLELECPWFGEAEGVSEEIGMDMLTDVLPPKIGSLVGASQLVAWHNRQVRSRTRLSEEAASLAYASLVRTVSRFGVEDGLGSGDFWVMEDSFSGPDALVMAFKPLPLPLGMESALTAWLRGQSAMKRITLVNREGDPLFEVASK